MAPVACRENGLWHVAGAMRPIPRAPVVLFASTVALLFGCGGTIPGEDASGLAESELRTRYDEFPAVLSESEFERWSTARGTLIKGFDRICGDTICSGDFSNLSTLELTCSATSKMKKVKDCVWVLGGSIGYVDGRTGALSTEPRVFTCHIPVAGTANELLSTLTQAGDDALNAPLANGASFYDGLTKCFEGVVGQPPPASTGTVYRDLAEQLWEVDADQGAQWSQVERALARSFDDVCGDTFCEGDYNNIALLDFSCAARATTGRVRTCRATFGLAATQVSARGALSTNTTTRTCDVSVHAPRAALLSALSGPEPLRASLPGKTSSIYDALVDCL